MLRREEIERFYKDLEGLDLKFPVAAIAKATGHSKANVSKYLSRKLEPSEAFLKAFYDKVQISSKNVSHETPKVFVSHKAGDDHPSSTGQLLETINLLIRQNDKLADTNRILSEKIATIPVGDQSETQRSVDAMLQGLREFALKISIGTRYKSLEEARGAYRKELGGVLEKTKARDSQNG